MRNILIHVWKWISYPIDLVVYWEGKMVVHWCKDYADAFDWLAQYPKTEISYRMIHR